jgi:indolepyruvate ferredoxin oxidoreductase alpha subunit
MTGHQNNPASGKTISGEATFELDLEAISKACGVKRVVTVDPKDTQLLEKTILEETQAEEPSVIITKRRCILVKS